MCSSSLLAALWTQTARGEPSRARPHPAARPAQDEVLARGGAHGAHAALFAALAAQPLVRLLHRLLRALLAAAGRMQIGGGPAAIPPGRRNAHHFDGTVSGLYLPNFLRHSIFSAQLRGDTAMAGGEGVGTGELQRRGQGPPHRGHMPCVGALLIFSISGLVPYLSSLKAMVFLCFCAFFLWFPGWQLMACRATA